MSFDEFGFGQTRDEGKLPTHEQTENDRFLSIPTRVQQSEKAISICFFHPNAEKRLSPTETTLTSVRALLLPRANSPSLAATAPTASCTIL